MCVRVMKLSLLLKSVCIFFFFNIYITEVLQLKKQCVSPFQPLKGICLGPNAAHMWTNHIRPITLQLSNFAHACYIKFSLV